MLNALQQLQRILLLLIPRSQQSLQQISAHSYWASLVKQLIQI